MKRREFIGLLGGAASWPLASSAQHVAKPVIGFLRMTSAEDSAHLAAAFREGLKESGYVEGDNLAIEYRYADNHRDRAAALAADLIERQVAVIVTDQGAREAKATTSTIPILFIIGADPVADGLVESINRPGANVTASFSFRLNSGRNASSCCANSCQRRQRSACLHFLPVPKIGPNEARSKPQQGPRVSTS